MNKLTVLSLLVVASLLVITYFISERNLETRLVNNNNVVSTDSNPSKKCLDDPRCVALMKNEQQNYKTSIENNTKKANEIRKQLEEKYTSKMGEKFTLWGIEYQVASATNYKPEYDFHKTSGKYVAVKVKVTNTEKTASGVNKIYVQDSKGRQYEPAMLGYQQLGVEDYGWGEVQAGFTKTLGVIFEVAKDSADLELKYPTSQGTVVKSIKLGL